MARDTKLRMSIDPKIIERLDEMQAQIDEVTKHKINAYQLKQIRLSVPNSTDYILFDFNVNWSVKRCRKKTDMFDMFAEDGWEVVGMKDKAVITTLGKMAVDINREIEECLDQIQVELDNIENPIYCPKCDHCGETGCCGFIGFLEKHVRGKTDCLYETEILNDLEEWIKDKDD